nr:immunoglobulin heavy chain junction region [Mus musculus]MBK4196268.1 immunoglobulin heavy chain junction region [Mus musculus]
CVRQGDGYPFFAYW